MQRAQRRGEEEKERSLEVLVVLVVKVMDF